MFDSISVNAIQIVGLIMPLLVLLTIPASTAIEASS
jgi:hypothetical protein